MKPKLPKKRTAKAEAERRAFIESLCGKYPSLTSSEEFARQKAREIELEAHTAISRER